MVGAALLVVVVVVMAFMTMLQVPTDGAAAQRGSVQARNAQRFGAPPGVDGQLSTATEVDADDELLLDEEYDGTGTWFDGNVVEEGETAAEEAEEAGEVARSVWGGSKVSPKPRPSPLQPALLPVLPPPPMPSQQPPPSVRPSPNVGVRISLKDQQAACLDGTPAVMYVRPGRGTGAVHWLVFFAPGGYCPSRNACGSRSHTERGTSFGLPATSALPGPFTYTSCVANPAFCTWTHVVVPYCDGAFFAGNVSGAVRNENARAAAVNPVIHMRGFAVLQAVFNTLAAEGARVAVPGAGAWADAQRIFVSGCSAGGATAFIHGDYIHDTWVAPLRAAQAARGYLAGARADYAIVATSGLLYARANVHQDHVFEHTIRAMAASSEVVVTNPACAAAFPPNERWRCMDPLTAYAHLRSRVFVLNSLTDEWVVQCALTAIAAPYDTARCMGMTAWQPCARALELCEQRQVAKLAEYRVEMEAAVRATVTAATPGNGGVMFSCRKHCGWPTTVAGVSVTQLLAAWVADPVARRRSPLPGTPALPPPAPATNTSTPTPWWLWDCHVTTNAECNPTCPTPTPMPMPEVER